MPKKTEKAIQICPFSSGLTSSPGYAYIHCYNQGALDGISLKFRSTEVRDDWTEDYCNCFCYKGCVIYQALETLNLENEK